MKRFAALACVLYVASGFSRTSIVRLQADATYEDAAFDRFWDARNPEEAAKAAQEIAKSGEAFGDVLERLKRGRHWLVIDRVAQEREGFSRATEREGFSRATLDPDLNFFSGDGFNRGRELFGRSQPSGRVDAERTGNTVRLKTRGVAELTLLLSPDAFDFSQPVIVEANGRRLVDARAAPSVDTLLKWAARDNDRTMLFGAELHVTIGQGS